MIKSSPELEAAGLILRATKKGEERCGRGCGEMGSCHPNLNREARFLAEFVVKESLPPERPTLPSSESMRLELAARLEAFANNFILDCAKRRRADVDIGGIIQDFKEDVRDA